MTRFGESHDSTVQYIGTSGLSPPLVLRIQQKYKRIYCCCLGKMDRVTISAEASFDSDYCWDIDEQVGCCEMSHKIHTAARPEQHDFSVAWIQGEGNGDVDSRRLVQPGAQLDSLEKLLGIHSATDVCLCDPTDCGR